MGRGKLDRELVQLFGHNPPNLDSVHDFKAFGPAHRI